jgi:hypothetical protein
MGYRFRLCNAGPGTGWSFGTAPEVMVVGVPKRRQCIRWAVGCRALREMIRIERHQLPPISHGVIPTLAGAA